MSTIENIELDEIIIEGAKIVDENNCEKTDFKYGENIKNVYGLFVIAKPMYLDNLKTTYQIYDKTDKDNLSAVFSPIPLNFLKYSIVLVTISGYIKITLTFLDQIYLISFPYQQ